MSEPTRIRCAAGVTMSAAIRAALFTVLASCATGATPGNTGGDDDVPRDAPGHQDASQVTGDARAPDASPPIDAPSPVDAFVFQDAAIDASLFCSANNQCTTSGECCIRLGGPMGFCGPGIPIGTECLPQ